MDTASGVGTRLPPRAGAITICIKCGHLQAYGQDMTFRELTDAEVVDIAGDVRIVAMQKARAEVQTLRMVREAMKKAGFAL